MGEPVVPLEAQVAASQTGKLQLKFLSFYNTYINQTISILNCFIKN